MTILRTTVLDEPPSQNSLIDGKTKVETQ